MKRFLFGVSLLSLGLVWLPIFVLISTEAEYTFYWLTGVWLPWYGAPVGILVPPLTFAAWVLMWLLHFVPTIHWPLFP